MTPQSPDTHAFWKAMATAVLVEVSAVMLLYWFTH